MAFNHILIIRTGALGDVILTLPVIQNLQRARPKTQIHLLGNPRLLGLASNVQIHDIDRAQWAPLFASDARLSPHLADFLSTFDLVISYLPDPDGAFTHNLRQAGIPTVVTCAPRPPDNAQTHAIDHLLSPLRQLGVPILETQPHIVLAQGDRSAISPYQSDRQTLLIHPGSGSPAKCWPAEHFAQTADALAKTTGCRVLISSGPADADRAHRVAKGMAHPAQILDQIPLPHLAALMATSTAYLGNDSGPSHLASAVGLPSVVLFGPTNPAHWAPRGETVHILQASDKNVASILPNQVTSQIRSILPS